MIPLDEKALDLLAENARLRRLADMHERDRQLVAFEIHDGLAQNLAAALLFLETAHESSLPHPAGEHLNSAIKLLRDAVSESRRLMTSLRPPELAEKGVIAAIESLLGELRAHSSVALEFLHKVEFERLPSPLETAIYRVVQEGLTNACRHSQSQEVVVTLTQLPGWVEIEVRDWGVGFDTSQAKQGRFGLAGIRERARLFGGRAKITSSPGQGTRVFVELPLSLDVPQNDPSR